MIQAHWHTIHDLLLQVIAGLLIALIIYWVCILKKYIARIVAEKLYNEYMPHVITNPKPAGNLDDMPEIHTGNTDSIDLAATTNDRLKKTVWELRALNVTMGEVVRQQKSTIRAEGDTKEVLESLITTIKKLDDKNGKLQNAVAWLTLVTVVLVIIQTAVSILPLLLPKEKPVAQKVIVVLVTPTPLPAISQKNILTPQK